MKTNPGLTEQCISYFGKGVGGNCRGCGVNYKIQCQLCPAVYIGESSRNLFTRCQEHLNTFKSEGANSFMKKHQDQDHRGVEPVYTAKVTSLTRDCLTRQVREAVLIRRSQVQVLNSKSEWHQPALFRVQQEIERGWIMGCPSMKSTGANWSRKFFHLSFWYWIMNNQLICNLEYCQKWSGRKPKLVFDNANKLFHVTFAYEDRKQFDAHKS